MPRQMTYDETMAWGAREWADVTGRIRRDGFGAAEFTQTGGMCAAIVVGLEDGYYLLVTDADDTLSWERRNHCGWYVGLYPSETEDSSEPLAYAEHPDGGTDTLIRLIRAVLRDGAAAVL